MVDPVARLGAPRERAQRLDPRKRLAFHPLEEGAARRGDIGEIVGDPGLVERAILVPVSFGAWSRLI
jgi:hypothetical protein